MFAFIDTETTGLPRGGEQPRIVAFAWVVADNPRLPLVFRHALVRPDGFAIPEEVVRIHGITTERALRDGRPLAQVLDAFAGDLAAHGARGIVAHNLGFDLPIVAAEYARAGRAAPLAGLAPCCTMLAARQRWPGLPARLGDAYARAFRTRFEGAHDAASDVWACVQLFFALRGACPRPTAEPPRVGWIAMPPRLG